jgi:hypothetical protein
MNKMLSQLNLMSNIRKKNYKPSWALVAHNDNPSYLGGRDHEDHGSKPALTNSS